MGSESATSNVLSDCEVILPIGINVMQGGWVQAAESYAQFKFVGTVWRGMEGEGR